MSAVSLAEPDLFTALELRDRGMALADDAEGSAWKAAADEAIRLLAWRGELFGAEEVRRLAGDPVHCNAVGPRFQAAVRSGVIEVAGTGLGTRPQSRARMVRLYRGAR